MDVEGGERKALFGAMKTIERFHPTLLIEWNPETIQRFYAEDPVDLFGVLNSNWNSIELLRENERISIKNYNHLLNVTKGGKGWEDLLCEI